MPRKKTIEYSIILPTYNEGKNIESVVNEIETFFLAKKKGFEVIVVDDSSTDGTDTVVRKMQKKYANIILLDHGPKEGIGKALARGYNAGTGNWLLSMDADQAFKITEIDRLLHYAQDYDLISGSKYLKGSIYHKESFGALVKSKISEFGNAYIALVTRVPFKDFSMNFRLMRKSVWKNIHPEDNENFFLVEMIVNAHRKGYRLKEVGVTLLPRGYGISKTRVWKQIVKFFTKATRLAFA